MIVVPSIVCVTLSLSVCAMNAMCSSPFVCLYSLFQMLQCALLLIRIYLISIPFRLFVCFSGGCIRFYVRNEQIALPTAPTDVIISEVAATSVRLEWSYKGPEDLQYYVIQYKPKNANQVSVSAQMWFKPPAMCSGKFCRLKNELGSTFATRFNPAGWKGTKNS